MKDFTNGSIPRLMIAFLIPLMITNILQALYMVIDAVWAGRLLGPSGVAIVATGMPVVFLLSSLFIGFVVGASILAGQAFGAHNKEKLSDIVSSSAIITLALSISIAALGVVFCGRILALINTPAPLHQGSRIFLSLIIAAMPVTSMVGWFNAIMNATGDSKTPLRIIVTSLIVNAALAPALITGAGIMPPLGVAGSALSTIIANLIALAVCLISWRNHHLSEIAPFRPHIHMPTVRRIIALGLPLGVQMIIVSSSFIFILSLANKFGPTITAVFGIGSRVDQFAFLAMFAVTAAISTMTAQNFGAGRVDRIMAVARWGLLVSVGLSLFFFAAVTLFPDRITGMFTTDPDVILRTRHYFHYVSFSYLALAVLFSYQGVLRGAGDTITSLIIVSCSMVVLRVPLCYYLSHYTLMKESGLWLGITVSSTFGALAFYLYYAAGRWKRHPHLERSSPDTAPLVCVPEETA